MGRRGARDVFRADIPERDRIDAIQEMLATAEDDRRDHKMQLVYQSRL
jgi:hypothetical protein